MIEVDRIFIEDILIKINIIARYAGFILNEWLVMYGIEKIEDHNIPIKIHS